jgi:hypothetical protein
MEVLETEGTRGGQYYVVDLPDGRRMAVSRKRGDDRVWVGVQGDPKSWDQQRGGVGTIPKLLDEWRARLALDTESADLYWALSALASRKKA